MAGAGLVAAFFTATLAIVLGSRWMAREQQEEHGPQQAIDVRSGGKGAGKHHEGAPVTSTGRDADVVRAVPSATTDAQQTRPVGADNHHESMASPEVAKVETAVPSLLQVSPRSGSLQLISTTDAPAPQGMHFLNPTTNAQASGSNTVLNPTSSHPAITLTPAPKSTNRAFRRWCRYRTRTTTEDGQLRSGLVLPISKKELRADIAAGRVRGPAPQTPVLCLRTEADDESVSSLELDETSEKLMLGDDQVEQFGSMD